MHPLDALDEYRQNITYAPANGALHLGLGNSVRMLGRYDEALDSYYRAHELDPNDAEILFALGTAEHDFGDLDKASEMYTKILALCSTEDMISGDSSSIHAAKGLGALKGGLRSPWEYLVSNAYGVLLQPPEQKFPQALKKIKDKGRHRHKKKGKE